MHPTPKSETNLDLIPEIVVKLREEPPVDKLKAAHEIENANRTRLNSVLEKVPEIKMRPLYTTEDASEMRKIMPAVDLIERELLPVEELSNFYEADLTAGSSPQDIIEMLNGLPEVDYAYQRYGPAPPPNFNPGDDPLAQKQGYLLNAPLGIDLAFAQTFRGGDGNGVNFIDLEQGWTLNHEDLVAAKVQLKWGVNKAYFGHGTAVLGQVVAVDNTKGIIGIARKCTPAVISQWKNVSQYRTEEAILQAVKILKPGDVLLIEAQVAVPNGSSNFFPVEIERATLNAMRIAYNKGIIVIEAAGNGGKNLDLYRSPDGRATLNRKKTDFAESGAILVGAASSDIRHHRLDFSNYGNRVDCFGWGNNIVTTGDGSWGRAVNDYTSVFSGTSGASPIIAGVAIIVQAIQQALGGRRLMPEQMRSMLSNPMNGTSSYRPAFDLIGAMPDLKKLLTNIFMST